MICWFIGPLRNGLICAAAITSLLLSCVVEPTLKKTPEADVKEILDKPAHTWTLQECEAIIERNTAFNRKGYQHRLSEWSHPDEDIFIRALPFTDQVLSARVRKETINKRLSFGEFKERLKLDLEDYTGFTLDTETGEVIPKGGLENSFAEDYTFLVKFENISVPHGTIEVFRAEEGFFLENSKGEFSRVLEIAGTDIGDYFVLVSDLRTTITFSSTTDGDKPLEFNKDTLRDFRLVFNGLQSTPIIVTWR